MTDIYGYMREESLGASDRLVTGVIVAAIAAGVSPSLVLPLAYPLQMQMVDDGAVSGRVRVTLDVRDRAGIEAMLSASRATWEARGHDLAQALVLNAAAARLLREEIDAMMLELANSPSGRSMQRWRRDIFGALARLLALACPRMSDNWCTSVVSSTYESSRELGLDALLDTRREVCRLVDAVTQDMWSQDA